MKSNKLWLNVVLIVLGVVWWIGAIMMMNSNGELPPSLGAVVISCICLPPIVGAFLVYNLSTENKLARAGGAFIFPYFVLPITGILGIIDTRKPSKSSFVNKPRERCPFYRQGFCATPGGGTAQMLKCSLVYGNYDRDCHVYPVNLSKQ